MAGAACPLPLQPLLGSSVRPVTAADVLPGSRTAGETGSLSPSAAARPRTFSPLSPSPGFLLLPQLPVEKEERGSDGM